MQFVLRVLKFAVLLSRLRGKYSDYVDNKPGSGSRKYSDRTERRNNLGKMDVEVYLATKN